MNKHNPVVKCGMRNSSITALSILIASIVLVCVIHGRAFSTEKWTGVDETVVEKIAKEHGREAKEPLINTDKGDLLLFVFLLAGTIAGFCGGYY